MSKKLEASEKGWRGKSANSVNEGREEARKK